MDGKALLTLDLGERLVTVARLLAAEHVRQELEQTRPDQTRGQHIPSLTQLAAAAEEPLQQYRYTPTPRRGAREAA